MIRRRKLGNTYARSPAENTKEWIVVNLSKIVFSVFISVVYLGILYVMVGVVIYVGREAGGYFDADVQTPDVYNGPIGILLKLIGIICILFYVFNDKPTKRG
ncbi:MAG: hypothetical protein GXP32_07480 [Kiritimatiellaeota bacterium]|nr:hypothetical protein [Kiritimatiellota bacterium]